MKMKKKPLFGMLLLGIALSGPPRPKVRSAEAVFAQAIDSNAIVDIAFWIIVFLYIIYIILNGIMRGSSRSLIPSQFLKGPARTYFFYGVLALISAIYSVFPLYTIYFALKLIAFIILAAYIALQCENDYWVLFRVLFVTYAILYVLQVIMYFIDPGLVGVETTRFYRMTGGMLGGYGVYASIACIGLIILYLSKNPRGGKRIFYILLMLVSIYFIYISRTRQTYFAFVIACIFLIFLGGKLRYSKYNLVIFSIIITAILALQGLSERIGLVFVREYESLSTFSGRLIIMEKFLSLAKEYYPFGQGYAAGTRYWLVKLEFFKWGFGAAHESVGTVALELGIPGAILLIMVLFGAWKQYLMFFQHSRRYWMTNRQSYNIYLLIIFMGAMLLTATLFILSSPEFAHGGKRWVILLITLQMLKKKRLSDINHKAKINEYAFVT
jgi:O-antigen ligase